MKTAIAVAFIALVFCCTFISAAGPNYSIVQVGLDDIEHTRNDGYQYSVGDQLNDAGQVSGHSNRYNGGSINLGQSAWCFDGAATIDIGLVGSEHTRNDGYKYSDPFELNEAGQASGVSYRYNGGSNLLGYSAWLYDGAATIDIGLVGSEHTRNDSYKYSGARQLNAAGHVIGWSNRYNGGSASLGFSAWLYSGATSIDIGLNGAEHTRNNGYRTSSALQLNEAGKVAGYSLRYNGDTGFGSTAWLYDGVSTINIGLTGTEHTRNDGYKGSTASQLNEAGQVRGYADRFNGGSANLGQTAWHYNGTTSIDIGLVGSEHARSDGYKYSQSQQLNEAGQVSGYSYRYNGGSTQLGQTAWFYNGGTTTGIGLSGSEHTRNDGYKNSESQQLNNAGHVSGYSNRYNSGSINLGRTTWLFDGVTTIDIGLVGSEHTSNGGYKYSGASQLNESGQVTGLSYRYNGGSTLLGYSTWLFDGAATIDIGLVGNEHTRNDGYKYSQSQQLNEAGQVSGVSYRYNSSSTQFGQDAWFYDPLLDQTVSLNLSTRSDGYAYSRADYFSEDGLVLGTYTLFDALDNNLGDRAFYFTTADGLHDLGALVEGGLAANGWDFLAGDSSAKPAITARANTLGQIVGFGKAASQSAGQMAYRLTPRIPGDLNDDETVDAADYVVWRKNPGGIYTPDDYTKWRTNFGQSFLSGSGADATGSLEPPSSIVPEPATLVTFLIGIMLMAFSRRVTVS